MDLKDLGWALNPMMGILIRERRGKSETQRCREEAVGRQRKGWSDAVTTQGWPAATRI